MQYINPIEILQLSNVADSSQIDSETIKKAKRRLSANIDLSDAGHFNYYGLKLSKGDCERAIDTLSNNDVKEFYLYLTSNKKLNEFLVNGNENLFDSFKQDSIFKLADFVNFISPYYASKFDKALSTAFEDEDVELLKSILKTSFLVAQSDINTAYKSVSNILQNRLTELSEIRTDIINEESVYDDDDIHEVVDLVTEYFPTESLNCLPNYFQSLILKIANEINYLNVAIWDNFDNTQVCQDLLEHILTLNIDGLNKPTFQKNYDIVKTRNQERIQQEKNTPVLKKYARYLIESKTKIREIEEKTTTPIALLSWVNSEISINDVNNLPIYFDEIKNQVALSLKAMSVEVWNSYSNIDVSIELINKANNILGLHFQTKQNLEDAEKQLADLKSRIVTTDLGTRWNKIVIEKLFDLINYLKVNPFKLFLYAFILFTIILGFILNDWAGFFCVFFFYIGIWITILFVKEREWDLRLYIFSIGLSCVLGYQIYCFIENKYFYKPFISNNLPYDSAVADINNNTNIIDAPTKEMPIARSQYRGNQLKDGASPLDGCFGKGIYSGNATLTIDNGGSSDAIVCLYSIDNGRTIRNEYIRKNSSFTMSNIAQGTYKIRVFYGNDWNPTLTNSCGTKGNFESDVHFSEFDGTEYFEDSDRGYTMATITLYTVAGGNASSSSIDQSTFFNN